MARGASRRIGGKNVVRPGAYTAVDYAANALGVLSTRELVLVGEAQGGKPKTLLAFSNAQQARKVLQGGTLLEAVISAFAASPLGSPAIVRAYRVGKPKQAEGSLLRGSNRILSLKSEMHSAKGNQISVEIDDGGSKAIVQFGKDIEIFARLHKNLLEISSSATTATVEVTKTKLVYTEGTTAKDFEFSTAPTLAELIGLLQKESNLSVSFYCRHQSHHNRQFVQSCGRFGAQRILERCSGRGGD